MFANFWIKQSLRKNRSLFKKFERFLFCNKSTLNKAKISEIPTLPEFLKSTQSKNIEAIENNDTIDYEPIMPYIEEQYENIIPKVKKFFVETYGCQMNFSDTEIVNSILLNSGYILSESAETADIVLINTCAIREKAEKKIWNRLDHLKSIKKKKRNFIVGILGCMAERLKEQLLEKSKLVDIVAGPDSYRDLPNLIKNINSEGLKSAINVQLSFDETYADITPIRTNDNGVSAWVSIMRGCNNMCSFCIVPFTRGRERSRPTKYIEEEIINLVNDGYKEATLLGQNVNSYHDLTEYNIISEHENSKGFKELFMLRDGNGIRFAELLEKVSIIAPEMRFRFTSPHPKDFPDKLIDVIANRPNVCKQIHVPAQSGNSEMLLRMRRYHSREAYLDLIQKIRERIPGVSLSSDFICGFCDESEEEFKDTLSLIETVKYDMAYLFAYSLREKTHAHRRMNDSVPADIKQRRLEEMIDVFKKNQLIKQKEEIGRYHLVTIDGKSKKNKNDLSGLTDTNKRVVFPEQNIINNLPNTKNDIINFMEGKYSMIDKKLEKINNGDYVIAKIIDASQNALIATPVGKSSINNFSKITEGKPYF